MKELLVKTNNRDLLDKTLISLGGLVGDTFEDLEKTIVSVRALSGDVGFLKFSIKNQGYGEIVGEREIEQIIPIQQEHGIGEG